MHCVPPGLRGRLFVVASVLAAALLAGVSASLAADNASPDFGFSGKPPIRLDVGEITPADLEARILTPDEVLGTGRPDPRGVAYSWVGARLRAVGNSGRVVVSVMSSGVTTEKLEGEGGIANLFDDQPDARLTARLSVHAEYTNGLVRQFIDVTVTATRETLESDGDDERAKTWHLLMRDVGRELDHQLGAAIERRWGALIVP